MPAPLPEPAGAPAPPPPEEKWYDAFYLRAFVDAYASLNWAFNKPYSTPAPGGNVLRAYDMTNGFAINWAGATLGYNPDPVGGRIDLRFGPGAVAFNGSVPDVVSQSPTDNQIGLGFVKQAYASWMPGGADSAVTLDFGKFDQPYGAEVADSQDNWEYTRGLLYWWAQPLFFTGLRGTVALSDQFSFLLVAVNGWNRSVDNNQGKTFGVQLTIKPTDTLTILPGFVTGPEQDDYLLCPEDTAYDPATDECAASPGASANDRLVDRGGANDIGAWRNLVDLVVSFAPADNIGLVLNVDYGWEGVRPDDGTSDETETAKWYGVKLGARYDVDEVWMLALRGEYYRDDGGANPGRTIGLASDLSLGSLSLTIGARPTPNLVLKLENRADMVLDASGDDKDLLPKGVRETTDKLITTTLGVVVTTN